MVDLGPLTHRQPLETTLHMKSKMTWKSFSRARFLVWDFDLVFLGRISCAAVQPLIQSGWDQMHLRDPPRVSDCPPWGPGRTPWEPGMEAEICPGWVRWDRGHIPGFGRDNFLVDHGPDPGPIGLPTPPQVSGCVRSGNPETRVQAYRTAYHLVLVWRSPNHVGGRGKNRGVRRSPTESSEGEAKKE